MKNMCDFSLPPPSSRFLDVTQCKLVVSYRRFGNTNRSLLQASSISRRLLDPWRWIGWFSRNVGNELPMYTA